jgi:uncharacterized tellurite resistance protein B-like protein|tara:strand:+ start:44 stop:472 length:429 start_codon:yes stop_codon:yes gene_type:complete
MFNIFKKKNLVKKNDDSLLSKTASLLIHAARIDENYTKKEIKIIKDTLLELGADSSKINSLMSKAEDDETNSNQILEFTRAVKNSDNQFKIKIVETLWSIIYSNEEADIYETNLMRRLAALLYLDDKTIGDIKQRIKNRSAK